MSYEYRTIFENAQLLSIFCLFILIAMVIPATGFYQCYTSRTCNFATLVSIGTICQSHSLYYFEAILRWEAKANLQQQINWGYVWRNVTALVHTDVTCKIKIRRIVVYRLRFLWRMLRALLLSLFSLYISCSLSFSDRLAARETLTFGIAFYTECVSAAYNSAMQNHRHTLIRLYSLWEKRKQNTRTRNRAILVQVRRSKTASWR